MRSVRRIVVVGFMAAGKTSVALALARLLDCEAVDLDRIISESEGRTIRELIEERGEDAFRGAENFMLRAVLERGSARVIALGGGAWTIPENRALIASHDCLTVWLDAPFELCWRRITESEEVRPLARDRETAERLYDERRPVYALAALRIDATEEKSVEDLTEEIIKAL